MKFPDCSPNFKKNYISESRYLFLNEEVFIQRWVNSLNSSHIVILDKFYQNEYIREFLVAKNYEKVYNNIYY